MPTSKTLWREAARLKLVLYDSMFYCYSRVQELPCFSEKWLLKAGGPLGSPIDPGAGLLPRI